MSRFSKKKNNPYGKLVFVYLFLGLVLLSCVTHAVEKIDKESSSQENSLSGFVVQYYNGDMPESLFVVYDELAITDTSSLIEGSARALSWLQAKGLQITEVEESAKGISIVGIPKDGQISLQEKWYQLVSELRAEGLTAEPVAYPSAACKRCNDSRRLITNRLSLKLKEGYTIDSILEAYSLVTVEKVSYSPRTYVLESNNDENILSALEKANQLFASGVAEFATPLIRKYHPPRFVPNDPLFSNQWHLQSSSGNHINIISAWDIVRGSGVRIAITDDGLQESHPDLSPNVRSDLSYDYYDNDDDPSPGTSDWHGTSVAGVAAARGNNSLGVAGAAFEASLVGVRLTSGFTTDQQEAAAMNHLVSAAESNRVSINNNSWGPPDSGDLLDTFGPLMRSALQNGIQNGRGGNGIIYVWAAGNGRQNDDNVNFDGYASSRYTIAIGASGTNGLFSYYSEPGASMLVNCPSSDGSTWITTTDLVGSNGYSSNDYTNSFGGTSSATPLASGIIALMLQRNPNLTWRDVQHILVDTAFQNDPSGPGWATNGSGRRFNHNYGFGCIDATAAVNAAATWVNVPTALASPLQSQVTNPQSIPDNTPSGITQTATISHTSNVFTEHVEVTVNITHPYRGDLRIALTSPSGMQSVLATPRLGDSGDNFNNWTFMSVAHWGEDPRGTWTLNVSDNAAVDQGTLNSWTLRVYGYERDGSPTNHAPVLEPIGNKVVQQGDTLSFPLNASDPDGDNLLFFAAISGIAAGYAVYGNTFTWDTTGVLPGDYSATFTVQDVNPAPLQDSETITITVTPRCEIPDPPATITASQGTYRDRVRVAYAAVEGAVSYWIYRNTTPDVNTAELIAVWNETTLDDYSVDTGNIPFGCAGLAAFVRGPSYYYWVSAYNGCEWSPKAGPAVGYAGAGGGAK